MFDSLADQIKHDAHIETSKKERIVKILAMAALSILLFGGLYFAIRMID